MHFNVWLEVWPLFPQVLSRLPWSKWFKNVQEIFPTWQLNTDRDSRRNKNSLPAFFVSVERWNVDRAGFDAHWRDVYGVHYLTFLRGIPHVMEHPDAWSFQLTQNC